MIKVGQHADLEAIKITPQGMYLDGGPYGEVLLPNKYIPKDLEPGGSLRVFLYTDSEDRVIATTLEPKATIGKFAVMQTVDVNKVGAFLDWGLEKDLFVPFSQQMVDMERGRYYCVYVYNDEITDRVVGSAKIHKFVEEPPEDLEVNQKVPILVAQTTDLGFRAVVDQRYFGQLYHNEIFGKIYVGQEMDAYIKKIREDGKIDLVLQKTGFKNIIDDISQKVLDAIQENEGFLPLNDKSAPEAIYAEFKFSKKIFKKAVGQLYKNKLITIEQDGIRST